MKPMLLNSKETAAVQAELCNVFGRSSSHLQGQTWLFGGLRSHAAYAYALTHCQQHTQN